MSLRLGGFLSYDEPQLLDFTGFDTACLAGANGQGKSTLLDAITWALFGCARGCESGQHQDRLIREGADKATVELVFELSGAVYKVVRTRTRSGRSELQLCVGAPGAWTNLASDSLSATQASLCSLLRMDYRTFTASAFLLQGRADDFLTRMKPDERKDVFVRLLDLSVYERLEEAARAAARDAELRRKAIAVRIEELRSVDDDLRAVREATRAAEESRTLAADKETQAAAELEARSAELSRLEQMQAAAEAMAHAAREAETRLAVDRTTLDALSKESAALDALLARREEVEAGVAEAESLRTTDEQLTKAALKRSELQTQLAQLEGEIASQAGQIRTRTAEWTSQADSLAKQISVLESRRPLLEETRRAAAAAAGLSESITAMDVQLSDLREEHARLEEQLRQMDAGTDALTERLDILGRGGGECPVCAGPLDQAHRRKLTAQLKSESKELNSRRQSAVSRREVVVKEGTRLREEQGRLKRTLSDLEKLVGGSSALEAEIARISELSAQESSLRQAAASELKLLEGREFAREAHEQLRAVRSGLEGLVYDESTHRQVRTRLEQVSGYAEMRGRIHEAQERRVRVEEERAGLSVRLAEAEKSLAKQVQDLEKVRKAAQDEKDTRTRVEQAKVLLTEARQAAAAAGAECARLAERAEGLQRAQEELGAARRAEVELAVENRRYSRLTQAFGRGGIPDLIIENALPELQQDASEILGELTNQEMSLQFQMQREKKSGGARDTFDVLVYSEGGVRDFQMFSGGEAFRIAFAIRLALSKLLVRRAGARLETLVVDEGFGSQDPQGRERLIEAIGVARRDFRKILVISHLDEMKDAFPVQIRVTKDLSSGSRITVGAA
ncbi:MAG TPA: SMC family ATPase [Actinomycetota bacterium]|nr:SMC family ATPase [Actinomycetota bacterium]